ncbi:SulP family inorganic anion transporter [Ciceribacter sp. L1K23]|uniref:SulP family inorganic anion transporter n=1 Tax=unclassified Ciceribacter TaxID=2628820 RepID=UPI001ABEA58C|nr:MULTISPECIES: SulP family inorganic anion transporter [unclassified Ciceribacter]MBO3760652.1 SulP family inorganic anion transporter [Ciceribacter sp. L1K22]MBR0555289.1 SulP family inorganic anion transporter [Ciceribacter sp. L1K23]
MSASLETFEPKSLSVLKEGYGLARLRADAIAGLTVAIVALPLSMAIAIASGVTPDRGLFTAIIGGFLVSLLGGSRHQIGGPAGAFIVLVAATVDRHGITGMLLAVMISGFFLILAGSLKLGTYIKFIPYPVTVGFTAGIAVIIFSSQLGELFGLTLPGKEPGPIVEKLETLAGAWQTINPAAFAIAALTILIILVLRRLRPHWPGLLIAICVASLATALLSLDITTIGSRFGGIPRTLPLPEVPPLSFDLAVAVLPDAIAFALLGAIESLLSAVVADGMTGRRHRSNVELVGQGVANIGSALFGGICVTGTIARTATNVRAGATSPVSGMLHALFLLLFMLVAAPLAVYIPLAALAGMLAVVAWNMVERPAFAALLRSSRGDAAVLLVTFLLVVFRDLTEGIVVGFALGALLFIGRMSKAVTVTPHEEPGAAEKPIDQSDEDTVVYRIGGAFFFGAAATVGSVLDRIADRYHNFVLDCSDVSFMDSTAANVIEGTVRKAERAGVSVYIVGAGEELKKLLETHELEPPRVTYVARIADARAAIAARRAVTSPV